MSKIFHIAIVTCAVFFCQPTVYAGGITYTPSLGLATSGLNFIYHSPATATPIPIGFNNSTGDDVLDYNYWADNNSSTSPPYTAYTPTASPDVNIKNISYSSIVPDTLHTGYFTPYSQTQGCTIFYDQLTRIKAKGGNKVQNLAKVDTGYEFCHHLAITADALRRGANYQAEYDTLREYIEGCAYLSNSYNTFSDLGQANSDRSNNLHRFQEYREWLKKVLYYNLDTNYYCADVGEILGTFSWFDDLRGDDERGSMAVLKFLVKENKCPNATAYYDTVVIPGGWRDLYSKWLDTARDPVNTKFDSTLPTLEDLDLGILRGKPADVKKYFDTKLGPIMSDISALENPFTSDTKIAFSTREAVAIKMEIFDVLGKRYYSTEKVFDQGENQLIVQGKDLPHGILYARFSASDGTVETVKLRHE
ncbi:MAG: hypothetical protein WCH46_01565 [bacterium]